MRMSPLFAVTTAFLLFCTVLSAQKKSVEGYYITTQYDTIKGVFPAYVQWNKNPSQVEFVAAGSTKPTRLTPHNTNKFVVEGYDEYLSYNGRRLVNPIDDDVLLDERSFIGLDDSTQQVTTFLRLATRTTNADLYVLNDGKRTNFFYQTTGQPLTELRYKTAYIGTQFRDIADYKQQLNNQFSASISAKNLASRLEQLPYTEEGLSSFFQQLFPPAKQKSNKRGEGATLVLSAGAAINMIDVEADRSFTSVPTSYGSSFSPMLSVGFIVPVGRNFGRFFFYPQVKLFRYKNRGEQSDGAFINAVTYQADLAASAQISGGVNAINQENLRFYVTAGAGLLGQIGGKEVQQQYAASNRVPYLTSRQAELVPLTYAIDASAGVELNKRVLLSATYMLPTSINKAAFYMIKLSGVQLRVGFKLKG